MAKALKCDKCGEFFDYKDGIKRYNICDMNHPMHKTLDLCPECYDKFTKWLTGEREHEEVGVGTGELYPGEFESRHYEFEEEE